MWTTAPSARPVVAANEKRVVFRMRQRVRRQAMPVDVSINWKPLRNPHYVIASLQPGQGGRRQLFVKQPLLVQVQDLVQTAPAREVFGLLLGERFECSATQTNYLLIESLIQVPLRQPGLDATVTAMRQTLDRHKSPASMEVVGWYCSTVSAESYVSRTHATIHTALFPEPWQTALIVSESGGAFFLHDALSSRWFHTPFYEVTEPTRRRLTAKPTCVSWSEYLTTDSVVPLPRRQISAPTPPPRVMAERRPRPVSRRPIVRVRFTPLKSAPTWARRASSQLFRREIFPRAIAAGTSLARVWRTARRWVPEASARLFAHAIAPGAALVRSSFTSFAMSLARGAAATVRISAERLAQFRAARAARSVANRTKRQAPPVIAEHKAPVVVEQKAPPVVVEHKPMVVGKHKPAVVVEHKPALRPTTIPADAPDFEDTTASDHVYRYLSLARSEGFTVVAKFDGAGSKHTETLWVLTEPESGFLLMLVTRALDVLGASLQYNLHAADDAALQATFAEHRDRDSRTIFVRESCVEQLRARCRCLRSAGTLEPCWKVAPNIRLLTPTEWQSRGSGFDESALRSLSRERIDSLPEHVRRQFRFALPPSQIHSDVAIG